MAENEVFQEAEYKLKETPPLFLGTIQQRYRPRNGAPARAFAEWIKEINELVQKKLLPVLKSYHMCISEDKLTFYDDPYNLINIADFNSLIAQSQEHNTPIFLLTQEQVKQTGITWTNMERSRDEFFVTFKTLAERIVNVTV